MGFGACATETDDIQGISQRHCRLTPKSLPERPKTNGCRKIAQRREKAPGDLAFSTFAPICLLPLDYSHPF